MHKPLIGLTPSHDSETDDITMRPTYLNAVKEAGGIPVVLPLEIEKEDLQRLVDLLDGFLFTGGPDVHPSRFGEETHIHCGNVSTKRDCLELMLLPMVMEQKKPILAICRGIQLINIGLGGTIYQDIPSQFPKDFPIAHKQPFYYTTPSHTVAITPETKMADICQQPSIQVNSMHHQAVRDLAPGLTACALASDGLIEGVEMPGYPWFLAVQWHPEYLWETDSGAAGLFRSFERACRTP